MVSEVKIVLDKERTLRFDFNAIRAYHRATGKNLLTGGVLEEIQRLDPEALVTLLWAALLHEDKELTIDSVGAMFGFRDIDKLADSLIQAFDLSTPEADPSDPTKSRPRKK